MCALIDPGASNPVMETLDRLHWTPKYTICMHYHHDQIGDIQARVINIPGHTEGHVAYWFLGAKALFSSNSLMALGCGRVHEGTAKTMWNSLLKLREIPPETNVYCAHEHTQTYLQFARAMDPDNEALQKRGEYIMERRQLNLLTVPSLLVDEIAINPFLRPDVEELRRAFKLDGRAPPATAFGRLRKHRDNF